MARALGKQGLQWNAVLGGGGGFLPNVITKQITRYVRRRVISRTGRLWFLRLLPFGIGAIIGGVGARAVARSVSEALHERSEERRVGKECRCGGAGWQCRKSERNSRATSTRMRRERWKS